MTEPVEAQARRAAAEFRRTHGLGDQPLGDLVSLIEQTTGHDVAILDVDSDEHGLMMRDPVRNRVFIGVARTPHPMRQRSSLAHELAHIVFEDHADELAERSTQEIRADAFARHLLVPIRGLTAWLGSGVDPTEALLSNVVQRFLVSPAIAAIALREAGFIGGNLAKKWMKTPARSLATRFGWSDYYFALQADADRVRAPQRLLARAVLGYAEGVVSAQTVATLRGVSVGSLLEELAAAGIVPKEPDEAEFELGELPAVDVDLSGLEDPAVAP